jgi:hypothetical protein
MTDELRLSLLTIPSQKEIPMSDAPVLETIAQITAVSLGEFDGSARELMLARLAALVAVDAPEASYLMHVGASANTDVTLQDVQNVLVAVAPIVGTPKVVAAATKIATALAIVVEIADLDDTTD